MHSMSAPRSQCLGISDFFYLKPFFYYLPFISIKLSLQILLKSSFTISLKMHQQLLLLLLLLLSRFSHVLLCDPIDGSSPCSPVPGILQARTLEWVSISQREKPFISQFLSKAEITLILSICFLYQKSKLVQKHLRQ